jgi:hypothetical protein
MIISYDGRNTRVNSKWIRLLYALWKRKQRVDLAHHPIGDQTDPSFVAVSNWIKAQEPVNRGS